MCIRDRSSDCASMRSRGGTAVLELLATPARAIIIAADPGRHARYRGVPRRGRAGEDRYPRDLRVGPVLYRRLPSSGVFHNCLLYTSDAADDLTRVDLGGRRIIKKKK